MRSTLRLAVLLTAFLFGAVYAQDVPTTPVGKALDHWLSVLEINEEEKFRAHHETALTPGFKEAVPVDHYVQVCGQLRDLVGAGIAEVQADGDHKLTAWVNAPTGWLEILFQVQASPPHLIEGLLVRPGGPPPGADAPREPDFPASGTLHEMLEHARKVGGFPAIAAAYSVDGEIRDVAVTGVRDVERGAAVEATDLFHIGSVTKSFTATMIARLIEKGKIDWDTTVGETLGDIEMLDVYRPVTLRQLLQHRAGVIPATDFGDGEMDPWIESKGSETDHRAAFAAHVLQQEPVAEPGAQMEYSNAGYMLAALMAERRTKKSWSVLTRSLVFEPMGLETAGFGWPRSDKRPDQPRGHRPGEDGLAVVGEDDYQLGHFLAPAGDIHMSIADLVRYGNAHLAGLQGKDGALEAASVAVLHEPPEGGNYACGWVIMKLGDGEPVHWHNGSAGTFYSLLSVFPETGEVIALAFNAEPRAEEFAQEIGKALHERMKTKADSGLRPNDG